MTINPTISNTANRAIVFAVCGEDQNVELNQPLCLMPLGPKTIIEYVLESAVRMGIGVVDLVVCDGVMEIREIVGAGERWGVRLRIHLVQNSNYPYGVFRFLCREVDSDSKSSCLLLHTSALVVDSTSTTLQSPGSSEPCVLMNQHDRRWSGVARLSYQQLRFASDQTSLADFSAHVTQSAADTFAFADTISLSTASDILAAQKRILEGEFPSLLENYRSREPGIWIGHNVRLHPTVCIHAPVFISENCDVGELATIGPNAFLGAQTIVGKGAVIENSIVMPLTGVGEELTLRDCIVSRTVAHNAELGVSLDIVDQFFLGDLGHRTISESVESLCSRAASLILLALTLPLATLYWLTSGRMNRLRLSSHEVLKTPAPNSEFLWRQMRLPALVSIDNRKHQGCNRIELWRDLLMRIVPSLWLAVSGKTRLWGVSSRTIRDAKDIPEFWKPILLSESSGLISESLVQIGPDAPCEDSCVADIWYATSRQKFRALLLMLRYARVLITGPLTQNSVIQPLSHSPRTPSNEGPRLQDSTRFRIHWRANMPAMDKLMQTATSGPDSDRKICDHY